MLETSIVGSLPKPVWLSDPHVLRAPWRLEGEALRTAQDDAVKLALLAQEQAGLDIVCDGEERRRHYIWGYLEGLSGIDTEHLGSKHARDGRYSAETPVGRIVAEVAWPRPVLLDALRFTLSQTSRPVKVTLPGPMTTVDSLQDETYGWDEHQLAMHFAAILNQEARELAAAGAAIIQFDEPCFNIYLDKVRDWGIDALERCVEGVRATTAVHICYGYGTEVVLAWKLRNQDWSHYEVSLPLLAQSSIDQVSVECAASGVDVSALAALEDKDVLLGVIDVGTEEVESPELVAARIEAALPYVAAERLFPCTDCGLVPRSWAASEAKLKALSAGASLVRNRIAGVR